jgi:hypothetical protein
MLAWDVVEARRDALARPPFVPESATANPPSKVALLRLCNGLLQRLSNVHDAGLCGRVLLFLGYVFQLSEPSGLNKAARFAEDPVVAFEEPPLSTTKHSPEAWKRYQQFWKVQEATARPWTCVATVEAWQTTVMDLQTAIDAIAAGIKQQEDDTGGEDAFGATTTLSSSSTVASGSASSAASASAGSSAEAIRHLTAPALLPLQVRDASFQRQVLLQLAILLRYVQDESKLRKAGPGVASRVKDDAPKLLTSVAALLKRVPVAGSAVSGSHAALVASTLLAGDASWTTWKMRSCPPFPEHVELSPGRVADAVAVGLTRQGSIHGTPSTSAAAGVKAAAASAGGMGGPPSRSPDSFEGGGMPAWWTQVAPADVSKLRDTSRMTATTPMELCRSRGAKLVPKLSKLLAEVRETLDPESMMFDADTAPYRDQRWAWRAMRLMRLQDSTAFETIVRESQFPQVITELAGVPLPEQDAKAMADALTKKQEAADQRKKAKAAAPAAAATASSSSSSAPGGSKPAAPAAAKPPAVGGSGVSESATREGSRDTSKGSDYSRQHFSGGRDQAEGSSWDRGGGRRDRDRSSRGDATSAAGAAHDGDSIESGRRRKRTRPASEAGDSAPAAIASSKRAGDSGNNDAGSSWNSGTSGASASSDSWGKGRRGDGGSRDSDKRRSRVARFGNK